MTVAARLSTGHNSNEPPDSDIGRLTVTEPSGAWVYANDLAIMLSHTSEPRARELVPVADYTIAAIPTLYRGRMYRSRLEARWAAFFDRLGWAYEYEPFDLGKWSPDFAITEPFDLLVEVKPLTEYDRPVMAKVKSALNDTVALLTRVSPRLIEGDTAAEIGWIIAPSFVTPCALIWFSQADRPEFVADIVGSVDKQEWVSCGGRRGTYGLESDGLYGNCFPGYTMGLWADACNAVQWEPKP